jgi:hypothetical protein
VTPNSLFKSFREACSLERLSPYKSGRTEIDALSLYGWNIALCEALYPSLQNLEIGLRNRIDKAITVSYSDAWWFRDTGILVAAVERNSWEQAEIRIEDRGQVVTEAAVVAELNFGFWAGLLKPAYDSVIWSRPNVLSNAFPNVPAHHKSRRNLFERFDDIRRLRNRVFHHEQIWHLDLKTEHEKIIESLGWLAPSLQKMTKVLDRFDDINTDAYLMRLKEQLMSACPVETKALLEARKAGVSLTLPTK